MRRRVFLFLLALSAATQSLPETKIRLIEQAVSSEMSGQSIPGVTIAVSTPAGKYQQAFGMADLENLVPMTSQAVLRLGSISKPITAVALLQLWEKGLIDLDAPIQKYVPEFREKQWTVTARQLLGHLAGVRHYQGDEINSVRLYTDRITPLQIFARDPLLFEPGTRFSYTTYGFNILGAAVEKITGRPFVDYVREKILIPAGMEHTGADEQSAIIPHRARGYHLNNAGVLVNAGLAETSNKIPGGGFLGTAADLTRFAEAVHHNLLLKPETVRMMWTSQRTRDGKETNYGMGWFVQSNGAMLGHGGGQQGISTDLEIVPADGIVIAVMTNRDGASAPRFTRSILKIIH